MKTSRAYLLLLAVLLPLSLPAQQNEVVVSPFTTSSYRSRFNAALLKYSIRQNLSASLSDSDGVYDFRSAFWPMELTLYKGSFARQRLAYAFSMADSLSASFQRGLLETVYTNWPDAFRLQIAALMRRTTDPEIFALCAEYLLRSSGGQVADTVKGLLYRKFDTVENNAVLMMLHRRLDTSAPPPLPPVADLLSEQFAPGLTVLYSFQRADRDYPGLVVVRKPDGTFVRDSSDRIFSVPQLARSISNLPFYLVDGNTPQGIFLMSGFAVSHSRFIGPTRNIQLSMPFEIAPDSFLITPASGDTAWTVDKYRNLLPRSWRLYAPAYQAYYAGDAGRTAIIAHGTTIDPGYYKGQVYYPQTPSLGCLCTHESWSPESGERLESDQQKLVDAVQQAGNGIGYAVVLELDDRKAPVTPADVIPFILQAEKGL